MMSKIEITQARILFKVIRRRSRKKSAQGNKSLILKKDTIKNPRISNKTKLTSKPRNKFFNQDSKKGPHT